MDMRNLTKVLLEDIKSIPLFQGIGEVDLQRILQSAHDKQLTAEEFFFLQGDPAERMFVLVGGRVRLFQTGPDGQQVLIRVIKPVTLFGLVAMTQTENYPVSAQAEEASQAIYWDRQELMDFAIHIPSLAMNAMRIFAERLKEVQDRFLQATTERVERRLARTLINLGSETGRKIDEGILIDLPLTRQDIAEMIGTTLFTVSRMLNQWEQQGLVLCGRERVIIRNPHGLLQIIEDFTEG